jgi:hypothetical protein
MKTNFWKTQITPIHTTHMRYLITERFGKCGRWTIHRDPNGWCLLAVDGIPVVECRTAEQCKQAVAEFEMEFEMERGTK